VRIDWSRKTSWMPRKGTVQLGSSMFGVRMISGAAILASGVFRPSEGFLQLRPVGVVGLAKAPFPRSCVNGSFARNFVFRIHFGPKRAAEGVGRCFGCRGQRGARTFGRLLGRRNDAMVLKIPWQKAVPKPNDSCLKERPFLVRGHQCSTPRL